MENEEEVDYRLGIAKAPENAVEIRALLIYTDWHGKHGDP